MDLTVTGLLSGALVGVVMGVTGAGGGILAVPLLVFGLHLTVAEAGPVGLLAVGISAAVGALLGLKAGIVRYRAALLVAFSGVLMAPPGAWLAQRLDARLMNVLFAGVLGLVAFKTFRDIAARRPASRPEGAPPPCIRHDHSGRFIWTGGCAAALSLSGAGAGALSGLLGVGGGFVMVPALQRYTDLAAQSVIATSLAVISLVSLAGVAASLYAGNLDVGVALPFAAGSVAGMGIGSLLSSRLPQKYLKLAFGFICLGVAIGMILKIL